MAFYQLKHEQFIPASKTQIWDFISSPANLKIITPSYMGFEITSDSTLPKMYAGMIISYKVRPLLKLPMTWVTEITQVKEGDYFVDEQRVGPYKMWHHEHFLEEVEGGVVMKDIVSYQLPFGFLGRLAQKLFIKKQLAGIFTYRKKAMEELFPKR